MYVTEVSDLLDGTELSVIKLAFESKYVNTCLAVCVCIGLGNYV